MLEEHIPFDFFSADKTKGIALIKRLKQQKDAVILVDLPILTSDSELLQLFSMAKIVVIPFQYGLLGMGSTIRFALALSALVPQNKRVFLPNHLWDFSTLESMLQQQNMLRPYGPISAGISLQIEIVHLTSLYIHPSVMYSCALSLELICSNYLFPFTKINTP
ncbi:MAG: hypothetical protein EON51_16240 [Acinetobacter sp.]|nr:MAG: hypothetical protein EON51_16240 [Acinetobacter sp.]